MPKKKTSNRSSHNKKTNPSSPSRNERPVSNEIRLNKFIANAGVCSRREADKLIESGEISVNNKVITEMGYKVKQNDTVVHNGKALRAEKLKYIVLNKPKDHITTMDDPEERKTVMNLIKQAGPERLFPVGRLDRNTTGVLILTNDGDLSKHLTHPSSEKGKVYQVELDKPISDEQIELISKGLELEDGKVNVDEIAIITDDRLDVGIELHTGRNRIVRRIFESMGFTVVKLDRVSFAGLTKKGLGRGKWRPLTEREILGLKK
ncbi:MAG: pseudouridine synthase [Cyclobacteriaceae bacterium]